MSNHKNKVEDKHNYGVCVIDIGSPRLGNIGWSLIDGQTEKEWSGDQLDQLFPLIPEILDRQGLLLGLEAPLFVPLRSNLLHATKARKGEERRPWSAGAGAQVLAMNLPIMVYIVEKFMDCGKELLFLLEEKKFFGSPKQVLIFEALVSGSDKGESHIADAQIMAKYCHQFSKNYLLPTSILEEEQGVRFFNLAAAALLKCGATHDISTLGLPAPIYKPS